MGAPPNPIRRKPIWPWALIALITATVIQSQISVLLLAFVGGPFWTIALVNILLVSLAVDALRRAVPRWVLVIPVGFYVLNLALSAAGYVVYRHERDLIARQNARQFLAFDPKQDDLIYPEGRDAAQLIAKYQLHAIFAPDANAMPARHASYRVLPSARCESLSIRAVGPVQVNSVVDSRINLTNLCTLRLYEDPPKPAFQASVSTATTYPVGPLLQSTMTKYNVSAPDGRSATYRSGSAGVLSPVPMPIFGCGFFATATRNPNGCFLLFVRVPLPYGLPIPFVGPDERYLPAFASLLRLKPWTITNQQKPIMFNYGSGEADPSEIQRITADNDAALALARRFESRDVDQALALLPAYLEGDHEAEVSEFGPMLASHADQVASYAPAMVSALRKAAESGDEGPTYNLGLIVAALPAESFQSITPQVISLERDPKLSGSVPSALLTRLGDVGPPGVSVLLETLRRNDRRTRGPAILGLCRAGPGIPHSIEAISAALGVDSKREAFVAYRRLGRPDLAQGLLAVRSPFDPIQGEVLNVNSASPKSACKTGLGRMSALPDVPWLH